METPKLTGRQKTHLRGLGQKLDSSLSVGRGGVTKTVTNEVERLLATHELVKVRVLAERDDRPVITEALAAATRSEMVGNVGKTVLLYRAEPKLGAKRIKFPGTPAS
jgi:RNA-binding protein